MLYKVTKKYARGPESPVGNYKTLTEAKAAIQNKLAEDALHKVESIYRLYEAFDLIEEFDQSKLEKKEKTGDAGTGDTGTSQGGVAGGSQKGSSQTFNPSPFSMTPHLGPRSWVQDKKDNKDNKDSEDKK